MTTYVACLYVLLAHTFLVRGEHASQTKTIQFSHLKAKDRKSTSILLAQAIIWQKLKNPRRKFLNILVTKVKHYDSKFRVKFPKLINLQTIITNTKARLLLRLLKQSHGAFEYCQ